MKNYYLITTDNWFYAPDGLNYRAVWGEVSIMPDDFLGIKTNRNSTNWYVKVGNNDKHVIIAGCQIHYAVKCREKPNDNDVLDHNITNGELKNFTRPSYIYIAE